MKIYSIHFNKPEYISLQKKTIDRHLLTPHELVIMNNSDDAIVSKQIIDTCLTEGLTCINCNNSYSNSPSYSHLNALNVLLDIVQEGDTFMILDHDVFFINDMTEEFYKDVDLIYNPQFRGSIEYCWPGMMIFNKFKYKQQFKFGLCVVDGHLLDTGGMTHAYLKIPDLKRKTVFLCTTDNDDYQRKCNSNNKKLYIERSEHFVHLVSGSNWNKDYDLNAKLEIVKSEILSNT